MAASRGGHRVGDRLAVRGEAFAHLTGAREVVLRSGEPEPLLLLAACSGLQAEQDVVRLGVLGIDVVRVVGRHQRQPGPPRDLDEPRSHRFLLRDAVILELEKVVVGAKDLGVLTRDRLRRVEVAAHDRLRQLAAKAG